MPGGCRALLARLKLRWILVAAAGLLAGLGLAYILSLPRITLNAPDAEDASTSATIELHFSRPVVAESVERRLGVEPPLEGSLSWPDPQTLRFQPDGPLEPDTEYGVRLAPGVRTTRGAILPWGTRFAFSTGHPTLLYLGVSPDDEERVDLWRVEPDGSQPSVMAELGPDESVHSYAVSPDGAQIALSVEHEDGSADLALLPRSGGQPELLLDCGANACIQPVWSPDGTRIAYEQRPLTESDMGTRRLVGQVWVLDMASGQAEPVVAREVQQGTGPVWSPDGTRLAFHNGTLEAIVVYDFSVDPLTEDPVELVPNLAGERLAWGPDGRSIVFAEVFLSEEDAALLAEHAEEHDPNEPHEEPTLGVTYLHLVEYTFDDETLNDLSGVLKVEDGTPVFSPDGRWLAFGRRTLEGDTTFGRQLWLYDLQNDETIHLLDEPTYNHGAYAWSPDSSQIAYMRLDRLDPQALADIWLVDVPGGETRPVVESAFLPAWLP